MGGEVIKSVLISKETDELKRVVAAELAKGGESGPDEAKKIEDLWDGAKTPNPPASNNGLS